MTARTILSALAFLYSINYAVKLIRYIEAEGKKFEEKGGNIAEFIYDLRGGWGQKSISTIPWVARKPLLSFYFIKNMLQTGKKFVRIQKYRHPNY